MNLYYQPRVLISFLVCLFVLMTSGCGQQNVSWNASSGIPINLPENTDITDAIKSVEAAIPPPTMQGSGLAGAMGGVNLKAQRAGNYDMLMPLPQLADGQAPVWYSLETTPKTALVACRLQKRSDGNAFVNLTLNASRNQDISIEWFAVVLVADNPFLPNQSDPEAFRVASACAQADDPRIIKLANNFWENTRTTRAFATNIRTFILKMKQRSQPMSLDAIAIIESGQNTICTANANITCALMRAKQVACRSIATMPIISRRFEMHRTVEYFDNDNWISFDPSSVFENIPLKPWQNIIMAKTSIEDEDASMKPRPSVMRGCPFGQSAEFARLGLNYCGQSFFWTAAVPLAEFDVTDEATSLTTELWEIFLKTGSLNTAQVKAASAHNLTQYLEAVKTK